MPCLKRTPFVLLFALAVVAMLSVNPADAGAEPAEYTDARPLMGTLVSVAVEGSRRDVLERGVNDAYREMARLSDMMNHYNPDSVVSAINRQAGKLPVEVPRELMQVLLAARRVSERSDGAFDVTVGSLTGWRFNPEQPGIPSPEQIRRALPLVNFRHVILDETGRTAMLARSGMRIDLGGIAKLYILDAGMRTLKRHGIAHAMINGGGDVVVIGEHRGRPWRIGIRHPRRDDTLLGAVELTHGWVVTSGDYERYFFRDGKRYHHILDPRTGYPTEGPQQVTLAADDVALVNGYSLAIMVRGEKWGRDLMARTPGLSGLIVGHDGTVWVSPGMDKFRAAVSSPQAK